MNLIFHKLNLLGNDFIVIDNITYNFKINNKIIRFLSNRHLGVGCDQLLELRPPSNPQNDFDYLIYNADGTKSGQCGNGALCLAKFIKLNKLLIKDNISLKTITTTIELINNSDDTYQVNLGKYNIDEKLELNIDKQLYKAYRVSLGNPHLIIFMDNKLNNNLIDYIDKDLIQNNNISFINYNKNKINIRTHERGVGYTLACGSAASAASIACFYEYVPTNNKFEVFFEHGNLRTIVDSNNQEVLLSGRPDYVFNGRITL